MIIATATLDALGTTLIGLAALSVHRRVLHEHKIDERVTRSMRREQFLGFAGITLVIISYFLKVAAV